MAGGRRWLALVGLVATFGLAIACESGDGDSRELVELNVGRHVLNVEIVADPESREKGLMFRDELAPDEGMLFVFRNAQMRAFWMRNTSIPLSIAYIDEDGIIRQILDMQPFDETPVRSRYPAMYALEVNQGRFRELGITAGVRIDLSVLEGVDVK